MHSKLSHAKAKIIIDKARVASKLFCVSADDLLAPYKKGELKNHNELCEVLSKQFDINICTKDFTISHENTYTVQPLDFVQVNQNHKLLVINCNYSLSDNDSTDGTIPNFQIEPDNMEFHLFHAAF